MILTTFDLDEYVSRPSPHRARGNLLRTPHPNSSSAPLASSPPATRCWLRRSPRRFIERSPASRLPVAPTRLSAHRPERRILRLVTEGCPTPRSPRNWSVSDATVEPRGPPAGQAAAGWTASRPSYWPRVQPGPSRNQVNGSGPCSRSASSTSPPSWTRPAPSWTGDGDRPDDRFAARRRRRSRTLADLGHGNERSSGSSPRACPTGPSPPAVVAERTVEAHVAQIFPSSAYPSRPTSAAACSPSSSSSAPDQTVQQERSNAKDREQSCSSPVLVFETTEQVASATRPRSVAPTTVSRTGRSGASS